MSPWAGVERLRRLWRIVLRSANIADILPSVARSTMDPMDRIDRMRAALAHWLLSPLQGVTLGSWLRLLVDVRFAVDGRYWPRAGLTTLTAAANSVQALIERIVHGRELDRLKSATAKRPENRRAESESGRPEPSPVFILGHYRSGTTHLQNLFATDPRLAHPNSYQATFPRTFLTTEWLGARIGGHLTMRKRPHDDVRLDLQVPTEDELALCADTFLSPHMGWHFPTLEQRYRRYLTFRDASSSERARWVASLRAFAAKLAFKYGRRIVFKSPCHTARVPLLLEAFPEARFVHIHRHPLEVFLSTRNMELKVAPLFQYQVAQLGGTEELEAAAELDERILWRYRAMYEAFFEDRHLIREGRIVDLAYHELSSDPVGTMAKIYESLDLPSLNDIEPRLRRYLDSLAGYQKNVYGPLPATTRQLVREQWGFTFSEWGYDAT